MLILCGPTGGSTSCPGGLNSGPWVGFRLSGGHPEVEKISQRNPELVLLNVVEKWLTRGRERGEEPRAFPSDFSTPRLHRDHL